MRAIRGAVAGLVLAAGLLTGCSDGVKDQTGNGVNEPLAVAKPDPRKEFLTALEEAEFESWSYDRPPDDMIAKFPPKWCKAAEAGHSVGWMLQGGGSKELYPVGWEWGTALPDAKQAVVIGIGAYCPEHRDAAIQSLHDGGTEY
jgi:hypothetical protein